MKKKTEELKQYKCGICGELMGFGITGEWNIGNNSFPISVPRVHIKGMYKEEEENRCCDLCNEMYVIPSRKHIYYNRKNKEYLDKLTIKGGWIHPKYDMVSIWNDRYDKKELV